jgi:hypothetical protein
MKSHLVYYALILLFSCSKVSGAIILSSGSPALFGATVDDFSSYPTGDSLIVSDGIFSMTQNVNIALSVRVDFNGQFGIVGRSVASFSGVGVDITFAEAVSAFGIHLGAGTVGVTWTIEAFDMLDVSLGSDTVLVDSDKRDNGFFIGWEDESIGRVNFSPSSSDNVIWDNLSYVVIPEPSTSVLFLGLAAGGLLFYRRRRS